MQIHEPLNRGEAIALRGSLMDVSDDGDKLRKVLNNEGYSVAAADGILHIVGRFKWSQFAKQWLWMMCAEHMVRKFKVRREDCDAFTVHSHQLAIEALNKGHFDGTIIPGHVPGVVPGELPVEKLNTWGGSLSLGNPFAATGIHLLTTAARRLQVENKRYAMVSSCAGGGLGAAILLENKRR